MNRIVTSPLVSVIIPCYNHGKFLKKCLDSVASQTYQNLEVVIIDDCSNDGSVSEIKQIVQTINWDSRFSKRTQFHPFAENQGAHTAINYGIGKANGSIISLLNSDDMYHPNRIELIVREMQSQGYEFVFSGVGYVDDNDCSITDSHPLAQRFLFAQKLIKQYPSVGFASLISNVAISTGNFVFTKALFNCVGEFRNFRYCHDWDFLLRSLLHTEPFFLDQNLYYYRFHGKNTFESLQSIGEDESTEILSSIIAKMKYSWLPNPLAPSSLNWPTFFELFLYWFNMERYLKLPLY